MKRRQAFFFVAARAGDLIGQVSQAMTNGLRLGQIARTIQPYPTQGEAIRKVGDVFNRSRLTFRVRGTMRLFLRLRREDRPDMLNEKQERMCTESRWDFSGLTALFLYCTLQVERAKRNAQ